jgi:hypothetical protein
MNPNTSYISTLRCEPHSVDNTRCDKNRFGLNYPFPLTLWRVLVDEESVAELAFPFSSKDEVIQLSTNECLPYLGEGGDYVLARHSGDKVVWFRLLDYTWAFSFDEHVPFVDEVYCFEDSQYLDALSQNRDLSARDLPPVLMTEELRKILKRIFPHDLDLPLYRIPPRDGDLRGEKLFRRVWNTIGGGQIRICDVPEKYVELHIGLDKREFSESVWQVGQIGEDVAICFLSEPYFPVWVCGFGQAFQPEEALFETNGQ